MTILRNPSTVMRSFLPSQVTLKCRTKTRSAQIRSVMNRIRLTTTNSCPSHMIRVCTLRFRRRLTRSTMTKRLRRLKGLKLKNKKMIIKPKNPTIKIKLKNFRSVAKCLCVLARKSSHNQDANRGHSLINPVRERMPCHMVAVFHAILSELLIKNRSPKRLRCTSRQRRSLIKMSK